MIGDEIKPHFSYQELLIIGLEFWPSQAKTNRYYASKVTVKYLTSQVFQNPNPTNYGSCTMLLLNFQLII